MTGEISNLVGLLEKTFEKGAWHGPSVMESLEDVDDTRAFYRLPGTHSIIELVAHMAAWRTYVTRKLHGDPTYKVSDELNFPTVRNWQETLSGLRETQKALLSALAALPPHKLEEDVPGTVTPLTYYTMVHGIIHHDLYHAGQIVLIKRAGRQQTF